MKIPSKYARSMRNGNSPKLVSALALAVIGLFCGSSSAFAVPLLGSALASFAVLGKAGVTNVPKNKISGNLGPAQNVLVGEEYTSVTYSSWYTLVRADISSYHYTFVGPVEGVKIVSVANIPIAQQSQPDIDAEINALNLSHTIVDIGSGLTGPILPVTGFESSGSFDQPVNIQSVAAIPEPATWALLGLGFMGLGFVRRRYG